MKKLLTFLTLLTLFFTTAWAETATLTFADLNLSNGAALDSYTVKDITFTFAKANGSNSPAYYTSDKTGRTYKGNTITIAASDGYLIKSISITGSYTSNVGTFATNQWSGSSQSVVLTATASNKSAKSITVTYEAGTQSGLNDPGISFSSFTAGSTSVTATITPDDAATTTYYKIGENGTYSTLPSSGEVSVDLTTNASPVKVYAYSTDGTNTTDPVYQEFTLPALGVSISPSSYTGYTAQTVTITPSNYVGDYAITYTINGGSDTDYDGPFELSTPGTYEIVATVIDDRAGGSAVTANPATITINQGTTYTLPFKETFNKTQGTGGNSASEGGDQWGGSIATNTIVYDNDGWSVTDDWGGDACIRLGTNKTHGSITSPTITGLTVDKTYTLTFKAAPWGLNTNTTVMSVTASGATVSGLPETAMTPGQWNDFTLTLTATSTSTTLTFDSNANRFWLDEINVEEQVAVADGYYLFGEFNEWDTDDDNYKFTKQSDGSYKLIVSNYTANKKFKFAKYENGTATLIGVDNDGENYDLHSTHHTGIAMNTGEDTYSINDGGEMIFTIHADGAAFDVDKQVYMKGSYNEWANEEMELTADGWKITKQLDANTELGFQDTWGNGIWHGCGNNQSNITVDDSNLNTDLALWTDGKNFSLAYTGNYTFTVSRDLSKVVIALAPESHNIICTAISDVEDGQGGYKPGGTVKAKVDGTEVTSAIAGSTVTLDINASTGYTFSSVTLNGTAIEPVQGVYSFTMPNSDAAVVANFTVNHYNITLSNDDTQGSVSGLPETAYTGQTVSFSVTPEEGYTVKSVTVTPGSVSVTENEGTYTFGMPPFDATVTVTYKAPLQPCDIPFHESWAETTGTGGHNGGTGTSSGTIVSDNEGWTYWKGDANGESYTEFNGFGADNCIRIGERSESGKAVSPTIIVSNGTIYKMTFDAVAWGSDDNAFNLSAIGAELFSDENCTDPVSTLSTVNNTWTTYTVYVKATASSMNITWEALPNKHRFFLDDVNIVEFATPEFIEITLADLCQSGNATEGNNKYIITDQLIGVFADPVSGVLWCKDQGNKSIFATSIKEGQVDFMMQQGVEPNTRDDWDQSNWIALQFTYPNTSNGIDILVQSLIGKYLKPVKGYYEDKENYTFRVAGDNIEYEVPGETRYDYNVYCATNFLPENLNIWGNEQDGGYTVGNDQNYFFMNPKIQEVCHITWAQWDKANGCFTVPSSSGFDGAFQIGWRYNEGGNVSNTLENGVQYEFNAVVQRSNNSSYGPKDKVTSPYEGITVLPFDLSAENIVTGINTIDAGNGEVKSVKYVNVAGMVSDKPFSGVNIVVTEYTDGSRSTSKMLRK